MLWFFHMEGYWGLAFTIWTRAIELIRNAPNSYWRFLAVNYTKGTFHLFTLLLTLPRKLIESYMNIPSRGRSVLTHHTSQASSDVGKWLSSGEAEAMVDFRARVSRLERSIWTFQGHSMQRIVAMEDRVYDLEKAMERAALIAAVDHVDHRIAQLAKMVHHALEAVDVDIKITRRTVENELAETAEVLGAFEYQDTVHD